MNLTTTSSQESEIYLSDIYLNKFYYDGDIDNVKAVWFNEPHFVPLVSVYSFVFICGIIGNGLVMFAVLGSKKKQNTTFSFMLSLAAADLLFILVCVPLDTLGKILGHWEGGRAFCKISGFAEMLSATSSILNLTAISIERFFVIVMPIKSRRHFTTGRTRRVIAVVWILSCILSTPAGLFRDVDIMIFHNNDTQVQTSVCGPHNSYDELLFYFSLYQLLVMFLIPTCIISVCYVVVIYALWISRRSLSQMSGADIQRSTVIQQYSEATPMNPSTYRSKLCTARVNHSNAVKGRKQVVKMLIMVVVTFLLCWGPKLVLNVLQYLRLEVMYYPEAFQIQIVFNCLTYIQSCINPVIYGVMCKNFRTRMKYACKMFDCVSCTRSNIQQGGSNSSLYLESRYSSDSVKGSKTLLALKYSSKKYKHRSNGQTAILNTNVSNRHILGGVEPRT